MRMTVVATLALATIMMPLSRAQQAVEPHCTADKKVEHYLCDAPAFQRRLSKAHTVRVDADRMDRFGRKEMEKLVADLGKQVVSEGQRPDLIFDIAPIDRSGRIDFGPGDTALATLTVYDPAKGAGRRGIIWVETFDGQEDRPWPTVVVDLIRQFKTNALKQ
ncbi:hypothetical protein [Terriglobus roseus]|nr:hypothetical protein [Terriglobus roseus]